MEPADARRHQNLSFSVATEQNMKTIALDDIVLPLSSKQRIQLFRQSGLHLCRLRINRLTGRAHPMDQCCKRCLLNDGLPGVIILPNGLCNQCAEYQKQFDTGEYEEQRLLAIIERHRRSGEPNCIVAYSGGKDSAAALLAAIGRYKLRPIAVLVDNGFIPSEIQEASRAFCARYGIPLLIRKIEIAQMAAKNIASKSPSVPCQYCIRQVFAQMADVCTEYNLSLVIGGHRFPPLSFPLSACTMRPDHLELVCISPLLSMRVSEADQLKEITDAGWSPVSIAGNTSNCKLIGYIEEMYFDQFGYNPHIYEVSKEIRGGFYSREEGMKKVERPTLTVEHRESVKHALKLS